MMDTQRRINKAKTELLRIPPRATRIVFGKLVTCSTSGRLYTVIGHTSLTLEKAAEKLCE